MEKEEGRGRRGGRGGEREEEGKGKGRRRRSHILISARQNEAFRATDYTQTTVVVI